MLVPLAGCGPLTASAGPRPSPTSSLPVAAASPLPTSSPVQATPLPPTSQSTAAASQPNPRLFDGTRAYQDVVAQVNFGARPVGSPGLRATGDYILQQLGASGWTTSTQEFTFRGIPVRNIVGTKGQGPLLIIGAHYDARARADQDKSHPDQVVPAADDGASGVAVELELARVLDLSKARQQVMLAFFDAEDDGELDMCGPDQAGCDPTPWPWSVGAEYMAGHLERAPQAVVVLDMVGDQQQDFYYERNSDKQLQDQIWSVASRLGYSQQFIYNYKYSMTDDHTPFLQRGYRAVDIIDFDYPYWHTTQDTADKVSAESLQRIGRVMQTWIEER